LSIGKFATITANSGDMNEFAHGKGATNFMNMALNVNPIVAFTVPYSTLGTGLVVINLSRNAVESMSDGGTLTLRTYSTGDGVVFEVSDTGSGIAEGVDVFELFTTTKARGSGIGLYVARQIVLAHSGSITYSNQQPRGTTFQITLPKKTNSPG